MIDDPETVSSLMAKMEAQLPIPAFPTPELVRSLRSKGLKVSADRTLLIKHIFYAGDEGGINCDITPAGDAKVAVVVSLTHLRIGPRHPLSREIRAYQRERILRIARSAL